MYLKNAEEALLLLWKILQVKATPKERDELMLKHPCLKQIDQQLKQQHKN